MANQQAYNARMSGVRQAVEWTFGEVCTLWAYVDMRRQQKLGLQPVGLFCSQLSRLSRGNQTADHFNLAPTAIA